MTDNLKNIKVSAGNKVTLYALKSDIDMIVRSAAEPFVSESSIVHATRPKDVPLASVNYGKLVSSPMGNNITLTVRLPKALATRDEFMSQLNKLFAIAESQENCIINNKLFS